MWGDEEASQPILKEYKKSKDPEDGSEPEMKSGIKEEGRSCNDIIFAILFIGMVVGMVVIGGIAFKRGDPSKLVPSNELSDSVRKEVEDHAKDWWLEAVAILKKDAGIMGGALALAVVLGFVWTQLLKMFTKVFVYLTIVLGIGFVVALGIYVTSLGFRNDSTGFKAFGFCLLGLSLLLVLIVLFFRKKINLTCGMMVESCRGVQRNPMVFVLAVVIVGVFAGFAAYWVAVFIYLYSIPDSSSKEDSFETKPRNLMYYMVFGFYWTAAFISAVFQMTVAGAVATWYFSRDPRAPAEYGSPALRSLGRALTKNLGSLAFGALILAIIQFINYLLMQVQKANRRNKVIALLLGCVQCLLGSLACIIKFINKFAYIQIAMTGDSFCASARGVFDLITRNSFTAVVVDIIADFVLFVGKLLGTAACTLLTIAVVDAAGRSVSGLTIAVVIIGAYVVFSLYANVIGAGVDTVFVCYMRDLELNKDTGAYFISPDLHELLQGQKAESNSKNDSVTN